MAWHGMATYVIDCTLDVPTKYVPFLFYSTSSAAVLVYLGRYILSKDQCMVFYLRGPPILFPKSQVPSSFL